MPAHILLPTTLAIDWPTVFTGLMVVAFLAVCLILILTVLIQRPQGGGLSGAFGSSAGSSQTAFGAKTGDVLTIFTIGIFVVYLFVAVLLNYRVTPPAPVTPTAVGLDQNGAPTDDQTPSSTQPPADSSDTTSAPPAGLEPFEIPPTVDPGANPEDASKPASGADGAAEKKPAPSEKPAGDTKPASTTPKPAQPKPAEPNKPTGEEKPPSNPNPDANHD